MHEEPDYVDLMLNSFMMICTLLITLKYAANSITAMEHLSQRHQALRLLKAPRLQYSKMCLGSNWILDLGLSKQSSSDVAHVGLL